jgi:DNA repair exonuclease SbcCD ATPase subunit
MIEHLKARGFTGIKRGMGLDEIEIDFTGREGLIALDGRNGGGKTSTLDLLHPFDCLASRDGALKNHCFLRDSLKELTFIHGGHRYLTRIKIDSESGRSEGYAFVDGSEASVVKGSISEYHKWAVETFGSPELFFASIFCAQNSPKISDMRVGELKSLFVEFLRLERYEAWADTAKQAGNVLIGQVATLATMVDQLVTMAAGKVDVELAKGAAGDKAAFLRDDKTLLLHDLEEKRAAVDTLKATIQQNALALQRRADIQGQIDRAEKDLGEAKTAAEGEIAGYTAKWRKLTIDAGACDVLLKDREAIEKAAGEVKGLEYEATELQRKIDGISLTDSQQKVHDLEVKLVNLRQQVKDLENDPELRGIENKIAEAEAAITAKKTEIWGLDNDLPLSVLQSDVNALSEAAKVGEGIKPDCKETTCGAIAAVLEAKEKLPAALASLTKKQMEIKVERGVKETELLGLEIDVLHNLRCDSVTRGEAITCEKDALQDQITLAGDDLDKAQAAVRSGNQSLETHRATLATKRQEIARQKALADRLPEIRVAEGRKADLEKQLAEVTIVGCEKKKAWGEMEAKKNETINGLRETLIMIIVDDEADGALLAAQKEITEIETVRIPAVEKEIQAAREKIATLQAELSRIEAAEKELEAVRAERDRLTAQVSRWKYLQIACGKNGLQALEIDGAAPLISGRANELLFMGYGPQFSVRIDTQDAEGR